MREPAVLGIGVDLVENERMREMLDRWDTRFKARVFLPSERSYCDAKAAPFRHYAGRFAVKEAVTKGFGTGIGPHIGWLDIEVITDPQTGAPSVRLSRKGQAMAQGLRAGDILISLSHTHHYAVAQALILRKSS